MRQPQPCATIAPALISFPAGYATLGERHLTAKGDIRLAFLSVWLPRARLMGGVGVDLLFHMHNASVVLRSQTVFKLSTRWGKGGILEYIAQLYRYRYTEA